MRVWKQEKGAVTIVEAAFVFPITFFIVFFMIMAGEAYYQSARVEYVITSGAIEGAARCENPMMEQITDEGVPNKPSGVKILPYRYILTGEAKSIAEDLERELETKIESFKPLLFRGMSPQHVNVDATPHMNIFISSLDVTCTFDIPFPIRMIFSNNSMNFCYTSRMKASVGDPSELVRNVAMIADIIERNKTASEFTQKISENLGKVGVIIN